MHSEGQFGASVILIKKETRLQRSLGKCLQKIALLWATISDIFKHLMFTYVRKNPDNKHASNCLKLISESLEEAETSPKSERPWLSLLNILFEHCSGSSGTANHTDLERGARLTSV